MRVQTSDPQIPVEGAYRIARVRALLPTAATRCIGAALPTLLVAIVAGGASAPPALSAPGAPTPQIAGCPVFPASSAWNQRFDRAPVARNSATLIRSIGLDDNFHADFGSGLWAGGPIGIPFTTVGATQSKAKVTFDYAAESDRGPYPIPPKAPIEGGRNADGDRHVIVVDSSSCELYELYDAHSVDGGRSWRAGSGAVFDLSGGDGQRPRGWTSADAAGLPILPGLARYDEVAAGAIRHALRFTAPRTRRAFIPPARHFASDANDPKLPPMGLRVRLKRSVNLRGLPPQARVIAQAMKTYGLLLADNGSPWYVSGAPSPKWDNDQLHALDRLSGRDFEVVNAP
jgi:hypothetical protein